MDTTSLTSVSRLVGAPLANTVAIDVMDWRVGATGWWEDQDGRPTGLTPAKGDLQGDPSEFRPDLRWDHMAKVIERFSYCILMRADRDIYDEGADGGESLSVRAGDWEAKLVRSPAPGFSNRDFFCVAATAPLAICRAALKAVKF